MSARTFSILCFTHLPPPVHGVSAVSERVIAILKDRTDLDIRVLPIRFSDSISDIGRCSIRKALRILPLAKALFWECLKKKPDFIYFTITPTGPALYRDLIFVAIMKALRIRRLYHLHGKGINTSLQTPLARYAYKWAFDDAYVILLAASLRREIVSLSPSEKCFVLPNGIPDPDGDTVAETRANPKAFVPTILYFSNLAASKGVFTLLKSLTELKKEYLSFRVIFAGAMESDRFRNLFNETLREGNLGENVEYVGPKYGKDKEAIFKSADIMAFPTNNDTFPLVILEAMSHGLPVVATCEGAIEEMVTEGVTGYLIPKNDHHALADRLRILLTNPELRQALGLQARLHYESRFTLRHFAHQLNKIIDACIGAAHRSTSLVTPEPIH